MSGTITLRVVQGVMPKKEYVYDDVTSFVIGRTPDCGLIVPAALHQVSRQHCRIEIHLHRMVVCDLGSTNGTFVNGDCIGKKGITAESRPQDLYDGDTLSLGEQLTFQVEIQQRDDAVSAGQTCLGCDVLMEQGSGGFCRECLIAANDHCHFWYRAGGHLKEPKPNPYYLELYNSPEMAYYHYKGFLGRGGFGEVHLAWSDTYQRLVAIKFPSLHDMPSPRSVGRARREWEVWERFKDPRYAVVPLYEILNFRGGLVAMISHYCSQGNLEQMVQQIGPLPVETALEIFFPILDALEYAHNLRITARTEYGTYETVRGVVHRDVRPSNIVLEDGKAYLTDFGLAKAHELSGRSGLSMVGMSEEIKGCLEFIPRTQFFNMQKVLPEVDVWSATATLFYLLTGTTPRYFPADCTHYVDRAEIVKTQPARAIETLRADLPAPHVYVINHALKEPMEIESIRDLKLALKEAEKEMRR